MSKSESGCPSPVSDLECMILKEQVRRREMYRKQFLKAKSDPCKHAQEAGYVFDPAMQRFLSMKVTQFEYFTANPRTVTFGIMTIILPMFGFGYLVWNQRNDREQLIRSGQLKPRDRLFKFAG